MLVSIQKIQIKMKICSEQIDLSNIKNNNQPNLNIDKLDEKILCNYCLRTTSNGIRCMGFCVADNDY